MGGLLGAKAMRVVARGLLEGADAASTFPVFVEAFYDTAPNTLVRLDYGLSSFTATLYELTMEER